jgi:hypothetical protein
MAIQQKQKYLLICAVIVIGTIVAFYLRMRMYTMPGTSYAGPLLPMTGEEVVTRNHLSAHVDALAKDIGPRNTAVTGSLDKAADYIVKIFKSYGYTPNELEYQLNGLNMRNIEVVIPGTDNSKGVIIVGAHYDTWLDSPGANGNASGVGCVLEMARLLKSQPHLHPIRLVCFTNEAAYFKSENMGSYRYALKCKQENIKVRAMISIDEIGYFPDVVATQRYNAPLSNFYPTMGNFLAIVGNPDSTDLVRDFVGDFRSLVKFPCEGLVAQDPFSTGMENSDHYYFWKMNYPALWISDTIFYRYADYQKPEDTANRVDVDKEARIVTGLTNVIGDLANKN